MTRVALCALVVAAAVGCAAAASQFGYMNGPRLFEATGPASDFAVAGFRATFSNNTTPWMTGTVDENALADSAVSEVVDYLNTFCSESPDVSITSMVATEGKVYRWNEDEQQFEVMFLVEFKHSTMAVWPGLDGLGDALHMCLPDEPTTTLDGSAAAAASFEVRMFEGKVFEYHNSKAVAEPPRVRLQAWVHAMFDSETQTTAAADVIANSALFRVLFANCLGEHHDMDIRSNWLNLRYQITDAQDYEAKFSFDVPWYVRFFPEDKDDKDDKDGDEKPLRNAFEMQEAFDFGMCLSESLDTVMGGSGINVQEWHSTVVIAPQLATMRNEGGVAAARIVGGAAFYDSMAADNAAQMEIILTGATNYAKADASDTRHVSADWVDVLTMAPDGADLLVSWRVAPNGKEFDGFWVDTGIADRLAQGLSDNTGNSEVMVPPVGGNDDNRNITHPRGGATFDIKVSFATGDISVADRTRITTGVINGLIATAMSNAAICDGCDFEAGLNGWEGTSMPESADFSVNYDVASANVSPNTAIFRTTVDGDLRDVHRFVARLTGSMVGHDAVLTSTGCTTDCADWDIAVSRVQVISEDAGPPRHGDYAGATITTRMAGVSFGIANSAEWTIVAEYSMQRLLADGGVPIGHPGVDGRAVLAHWSGCGRDSHDAVLLCDVAVLNAHNSSNGDSYSDMFFMPEDIVNMTHTYILAEDNFESAVTNTVMHPVGIHARPVMAGEAVVVFRSRPDTVPIADVNANLPSAVDMVYSTYNIMGGTAKNSASWMIHDNCYGTSQAVCILTADVYDQLRPEDFSNIARSVGYTVATDPLQVPTEGMDSSAFVWSRYFDPARPCTNCNVTVLEPKYYRGSERSFTFFLDIELDDFNLPVDTAGAAMRLAAAHALRNGGIKPHAVFVHDDGRDGDHVRRYRVRYFVSWSDMMDHSGDRVLINTDFAETISKLIYRHATTGCLHHLFRFENRLVTDVCEMAHNEDDCRNINDSGITFLDNGQGRKYFYVSDKNYDDMHLMECSHCDGYCF